MTEAERKKKAAEAAKAAAEKARRAAGALGGISGKGAAAINGREAQIERRLREAGA